MGKIKVYVEGIGQVYTSKDNSLEDLAKELYEDDYTCYLGARINNEIFHLSKKVKEDMYIKYLTIESRDGYRIYTRTVTAVFILACKKIFPGKVVKIEHFLGSGLYAEFEDKDTKINFSDLEKIKKEMAKIIEKNYRIERIKYPTAKAKELFKENGHLDKIRLYETLDRKEVQIYKIGENIDGFYGYLAPSTSYIKNFDLKYYYPGALILFPNSFSRGEIPEYVEQKKLAKVYSQASEWLDIMDLSYVSSLNEKILSGNISEVIRVSEALHEKKIAEIADMICQDKDINMILIAGPSASGKTTFSNRLRTYLKVNGKRPVVISADDYFVDREKTPLNEKGEYDFEALEAIDLEKFNKDLIALLEGETIELPKFNFITGKSEKSGRFIKVDVDHPIIVEGIHGLNPKLASYIPDKNKFKIYISALTQLNVDAHNRISTRDTRFLRRLVRDVQFRGNDVFRTFELWENVTKGEDKNIFPYQEEADIMFDTALVYELSVLKKYAIPLLEKVDNTSKYFGEAKRLLRFLYYFRTIEDTDMIPPNSLLREFIGGANFNVH